MSGRTGSAVGRGTILAQLPGSDSALAITEAQAALLRAGAAYIRGAQVRSAQILVHIGLATLTDNGWHPTDKARWWFEPTAGLVIR